MHYLDTPEVLEFVGSARCAELSALGTTCPDHFLRTKVRPLVVPFTPGTESAADIVARIGPLVERYASDYAAYYERCKRPDSPKMRDPYPVLILIPGVGLLAFQKDKQTARVAADYWVNAVNVIRWAEGVDEYVPDSRAGCVRHRVLAARGGEAAAPAQTQAARGPRGLRDGRGRRHRRGRRPAFPGRGRGRRGQRHRPGGTRCVPPASSRRPTARIACAPCAAT